jgi:ribose transport system ATP-binding protein
MDSTPALALEAVSKRFGATQALAGASLTIDPGEVHGLVGTNGSGKSTMIKILTGLYEPDDGELSVWGTPVTLPVRRPTDLGVAVVHQRLGLQNDATVLESVGTGVGYGRGFGYRVDWRAERRRCQALIDQLEVELDLDARIEDLPAAQRAVVAIMRALRNLSATSERHLLILDEPTVSMSPREVEVLMAVLRRMTDAGDSVLLVSHRLGEVLTMCRRVTILRDGRSQGCHDSSALDEATLLRHMLGAEPISLPPVAGSSDSETVALSARGLSGEQLRDLDLDLRAGQIVGVTGLMGSGHDELPYLVAGSVGATAGTIDVDGEQLPRGVRARARRGVSVVPGDRARQALWMQAQASENISLSILSRFFERGHLSRRREVEHAQQLMQDVGAVPLLPTAPADSFSGGNQHKIVLGRALQTRPSVVVLHEPTVGVDANAKRQIYGLLRDAAAAGAAVAVCSTDYEELAEHCDRIHVITGGRLSAVLEGPGLSESTIVAACNGARHEVDATAPAARSQELS